MDSIVTLRNGDVYEGRIVKKGRAETRMLLAREGKYGRGTIFPTYAIESVVETTRDSFDEDGVTPLRCTDCGLHVYYDTADELYYHREFPEQGEFCWLLDTGNGYTADAVQCEMARLGHHATYDLGGFAQLPRWTCRHCGATTLRQRHGGLEGSGLTQECTSS